MKKYISLMAFCLLAVFSQVLVSCSDDGADEKSNANGYKVDLPSGTSGVKIEPLSDEEVTKLKAQGYNIVGTPVNVTQDGKDHVVLDDDATVSFKIPENYPKEKYNELIGVLFGDEGPEYIIPDYASLKEGYVRFQTYHFCPAATVENKEELNRQFADRVSTNGWVADMRDEDYKKLKVQLKAIAENSGFGENDLLGIAFKEVLGDNDFVKETMEMIEGYDSGTLTQKAAERIAEKLSKEIKAKTLSILFGKLKTDPNNKAVKDFLKEHLNQDNMEDLGKRLGEGQSPATIAWEYASGFAVERLKDFSVKQVPYIMAVQAVAKVTNIGVKFFNQQRAIDCYNDYEKLAKNGNVSADDWNILIEKYRISSPKFSFGMTEEEIRQMFEQRYRDKLKVNKKKEEILKLIKLWDSDSYKLMDMEIFDKLNYNYTQRLTRLYALMERFRNELVVNGDISGRSAGKSVDQTLCEIIEKHLEMYPDNEGFYKWLAKQGYLNNRIQKNVDNLSEIRSWYLIRTDINCHDNTTGYEGAYMNYTASATEHTKNGKVWGIVGIYDDKELFPVGFNATVEAPPTCMQGGDSIVLHATVKRTTGEATCYVNETPWITFEDESIGPNFVSDWAVEGKVINLTGSKTVGTRPGSATSGEWDFVLRIPNGSKKNELRAINYHSCDSRTHWVYRWCSIFEKEEK